MKALFLCCWFFIACIISMALFLTIRVFFCHTRMVLTYTKHFQNSHRLKQLYIQDFDYLKILISIGYHVRFWYFFYYFKKSKLSNYVASISFLCSWNQRQHCSSQIRQKPTSTKQPHIQFIYFFWRHKTLLKIHTKKQLH